MYFFVFLIVISRLRETLLWDLDLLLIRTIFLATFV